MYTLRSSRVSHITDDIRCGHASLWPHCGALLLLALLCGLLLAAPAPVRPLALAPQLQHLAAVQPATPVRVIVQQRAAQSVAEQSVHRLGGRVLKQLPIIGAFAAQLPAGALPQLAADPAVRWISLDAPVASADDDPVEGEGRRTDPADTNHYLQTLRYTELPGGPAHFTGQGVGVAVVDSGISTDQDFANLTRIGSFNANSRTPNDVYGHGTHVAGIIGGSGAGSGGAVRGISPGVNLISVKISDETGMAYESDTLEALQWIYQHRAEYNIRVVNLSINTAQEASYHLSPLDAGVEFLWFNGIVVVASSGNRSTTDAAHAVMMAPANDPFIITVGATDEGGTGARADDSLAPYTAYGHTVDGYLKPEIAAPGSRIYSVLSGQSRWNKTYPDRVSPSGEYFRLSGTSMAAPMVAGAAALLLAAEPALTPDQVKFRLLHTGSSLPVLLDGVPQFELPYLDLYASLTAPTTEAANRDLVPSHLLLATLADAVDRTAPGWNSVNWNSVNWNSVNWNSVNWNSVNWNSVNWNSVNWNSVNWNSVNWNSVNWNSAVLEDEAASAAGAGQWLVPAWPAAEGDDALVQPRLYLPLAAR